MSQFSYLNNSKKSFKLKNEKVNKAFTKEKFSCCCDSWNKTIFKSWYITAAAWYCLILCWLLFKSLSLFMALKGVNTRHT